MATKETPDNHVMWQAVKWIFGVFAGIGFYLMAWAFNNFTVKLDNVYDFTTTGKYRVTRLEDDHKEMRQDINYLYSTVRSNGSVHQLQQGRPQVPSLNKNE
jgi:hypothetical protein